MQTGICGVDISDIASHLTATSLVSIEPGITYKNTNIGVLPLKDINGGLHTGGVELFQNNTPQMFHGGKVMQGSAGGNSQQPKNVVAADDSFDVVLMNPPYLRSMDGSRKFAYPGVTETERKTIIDIAKKQTKRHKAVDWTPGLAAVLPCMADNKLKTGARCGFVLPMSIATGTSWKKVRKMFEEDYRDVTVVYMSETGGGEESLSADTGMSEAMIVATRGNTGRDGIAVVKIDNIFKTTYEASVIAKAVSQATDTAKPGDSGVIKIDSDTFGYWTVEAPAGGAVWTAVGVKSQGVFNPDAEQLLEGKIADTGDIVANYKITTISNLFEVGPGNDLIGRPADGQPRGAFLFYDIEGNENNATKYKSLWKSDNETQTQILNDPTHFGDTPKDKNGNMPTDKKGKPISDKAKREKQWSYRTDLFHQQNIRWTSQKILVSVTSTPVMGGTAWAGLRYKHTNSKQLAETAFVLWANSTLGFVAYWLQASRTQKGRGKTGIRAMQALYCPDFSNPDLINRIRQHLVSQMGDKSPTDKQICEWVKTTYMGLQLKPANQTHQDPERHEIDKLVAGFFAATPKDIPTIETAIKNMRDKWVQEPSVKKPPKKKRKP